MPRDELDAFRSFLTEHAELRDPDHVARGYRSAGLDVHPDPLAERVPEMITSALLARRPLSVIRIGDGEANLLLYGRYPGTPQIDDWAVAHVIAVCNGKPGRAVWHSRLRGLMDEAVSSADVVGVLGLWRPTRIQAPSEQAWIDATMAHMNGPSRPPRAPIGTWRGIDYVLSLAATGQLDGKTIASAHVHLGVLKRLPSIVRDASRVLCVTNRPAAADVVARLAPDARVDTIDPNPDPRRDRWRALGGGRWSESIDEFLAPVRRRLDEDLTGTLVLAGAGPWSEIYCTWVRERGGVGVDFGSAFDLLAGSLSRTVHRRVDLGEVLAAVNAALAPPLVDEPSR